MFTKIHHGLTPIDWSVLFPLQRKPEFAAQRLASWIGTGYITREQASSIIRELEGQLPTVLFSWTVEGIQQAGVGAEARPAGRDQVRGGGARPFGIPASGLADLDERVQSVELTSEQVNAFISQREDILERRQRRQPEPFTEFAPAFEEMRTGFAGEMPPTERWRDWFRSKFPRLIEQFKGQVPEEERREKGWREFLARQRPEIREQWWRLSPFQRGERPQAFQPRIQTLAL
ncbi:MAG: hypothetical protein IIB90_15410 [Gemmatimonadetes bacterium]|nr:hypothetical protein [Gemmatimonadota bacterium]